MSKQKAWVGLTDAEFTLLLDMVGKYSEKMGSGDALVFLWEMMERTLMRKNGYTEEGKE